MLKYFNNCEITCSYNGRSTVVIVNGDVLRRMIAQALKVAREDRGMLNPTWTRIYPCW